MIPLRMTRKASPLYKAEQEGQRDLMRVPQRFACSVEFELPVRESVTVRRSVMGCEHVPTPIVEVGVLLLMPTDSWEMAVPVKWLKSGCIFLQLNGLILDADGAVGTGQNVRGEFRCLGCGSRGGRESVSGCYAHFVSPHRCD